MRAISSSTARVCKHNQARVDTAVPLIIRQLHEAIKSLEVGLGRQAEREPLDRALRILIDQAGHLSGTIWQPRMVGETGYQLCNLFDCTCYKRRTMREYQKKRKARR